MIVIDCLVSTVALELVCSGRTRALVDISILQRRYISQDAPTVLDSISVCSRKFIFPFFLR